MPDLGAKPSGTTTCFIQRRDIEGRAIGCVIGQYGALPAEQVRDLAPKKLAAALDKLDIKL